MRRVPPSCPIPGSSGCVTPVGPNRPLLWLLGEAAGKMEAIRDCPFVGEAGGMLDRILEAAEVPRERTRIGNCRACHPPRDWLVGAPWENSSCTFCDDMVQEYLEEIPKDGVLVTLGGTALRKVMGFARARGKEEGGIRVQDFHGAPMRDPTGRFWVVATFHPSHLNRGEHRLLRTAVFDLSVAKELALGAWEYDQPNLVIDPPAEWFRAWVDAYIASLAAWGPEAVWLDADIENKAKEKGEDKPSEDQDTSITFINFACSTEEGVTVPWCEPYIEEAQRALEAGGRMIFHNRLHDIKELRKAGVWKGQNPWERSYDSMDAWHVLHTALPRGLGFVAPFYSRCPPYKHLGNQNGTYRAMDGVTGLRCMVGIKEGLEARGQWEVYLRDIQKLDVIALRPAEEIGLPVDREAHTEFTNLVHEEAEKQRGVLQEMIPEALLPLGPPLVHKPEEEGAAGLVEKQEVRTVRVCAACGKEEVHAKHRCDCVACGGTGCTVCGRSGKDKTLVPAVEFAERQVTRYYRRELFNPGSWPQVLAYIKHQGHKPGRNKKSGGDSTDKKTLTRLTKTGDPFYSTLLAFRQADKMEGTYGTALAKKIVDDASGWGRLHGEHTHAPKTLRLASREPNLQNLPHHAGDGEKKKNEINYSQAFRRSVRARPGCLLFSADFSGIEAVNVGWLSKDPDYIRLAKLGIHAYVESHLLKELKLLSEAADKKWSDADLKLFFGDIKGRFPVQYDQSKRTVHGYNYGLTEYGLCEQFPNLFPKRKDAQRIIALYEAVCPRLKPWQASVRKLAHERKYLGGPGEHPFGYRFEFYDVIRYRRSNGGWKEYFGEDAKKAVAALPQSIAAGTLYAAVAEAHTLGENYIGDAYFGDTPLRALIHDEYLGEAPEGEVEKVLPRLVRCMGRPVEELPCPGGWGMGPHLSIGVSVKVGRNWADADPKCKVFPDGNPEGMRAWGGTDEVLRELLEDSRWPEEEEEEEES